MQPPQPAYHNYPAGPGGHDQGASAGYYQQQPQMGYGQPPPQQHYAPGPGGPYPPQGQYAYPPQHGQQPAYYPPQQRQKSGPVSFPWPHGVDATKPDGMACACAFATKLTMARQGFFEACLAGMACCCCLDILF